MNFLLAAKADSPFVLVPADSISRGAPAWVWPVSLAAAASAGVAVAVWAALRREKSIFKGLVATREAGALLLRKGRPLEFNETLLSMLGYSRGEFEKLVVPEHLSAPGSRTAFLARMEEPDGGSFETMVRRKDGTQFKASVSLSPRDSLRGSRRLVFFRDISQGRDIEEALRRSEARMRNLWECTVESLVFHHDGLVDEVNAAFTETFGFTRDETVGRNISELLVAPQDRARVRDHIRNHDLRTYEVRALRKDGVVLTIEIQPREIKRDGGTLRVAALRDITARKRVESRFAKQLSLFRATFDATEEGILVVDREGRLVSSNRRFAEMWNLSDGEIALGDDERLLALAATQVKDPGAYISRIRELYAQPTESSTELIEMLDGRIIERFSKPQVLYGVAVGRVWSFRDITARETARRELAHQLSLNEATLASTSEGVLVVDLARSIRFVNRRFGEMWAISRDVLEGGDRGLLVDALRSLVSEPESLAEELLGIPADPRVVTHDIVVLLDGRVYERHSLPQILFDEVIGRVWSFHDITDRVNAESELRVLNTELDLRVRERTRELEQTNIDLNESNTELEAFSYSVSHDLRAPLRGIDGFSLALAEEYSEKLDDNGRDYLKRVRGGVQRMGRIMDDLIHLSRVTRASMVRTDVDLVPVAREVMEILREQSPLRQVEFVCPDEAFADGDRRLLRVLLENLIGNAWKYSSKKPESKIVFGFEDKPGDIREFFVRDNGAGFDPTYKDKLFNTFMRLHGPQDFEGTGIGLAIVSRIVRRHGGTVFADGAPGEGAVFGFRLPKRSPGAAETSES